MAENHDLSHDGQDPAPSAHTGRRRVAALTAALVLCTTGGAVGGLAIGDALHHDASAQPNAVPGWTYRFPGVILPGGGTLPSDNTETATPATAKQLVGLVRVQSTLGFQGSAAVGTGMILSSNGEVVTNHHVIAGATRLVVTVMSTGRQYQATLVGSDAADDIAVLQLKGASGLATVQTDSSPVSVGQSVTAVGDAQGATSFTASAGKVTALDQTISPSNGRRSETLSGVIQYAAAVMSGDSGGATYNASDAVVGMTTAASTGGAQTNGYAIPIARVLAVAADLSSHVGNAKYTYGLPAFIGVGLSDNGVIEQVFPGTGAATSGLAPGDRIVAVDGKTVNGPAQLQTATRRHAVGDTIALTWVTPSGARHTANVRLIAGPAA